MSKLDRITDSVMKAAELLTEQSLEPADPCDDPDCGLKHGGESCICKEIDELIERSIRAV